MGVTLMDKLIILLSVLVVLTILAFLAKKEKPRSDKNTQIYRYSSGVLWVSGCGAAFFSLFTPWLYFSGELERVRDVVGLSLIAFLGWVFWFFLYHVKVYLTEEFILKITPIWKTKIPYGQVKKIVVYRSQANPGAAMTKVYGENKITLEALLIGYEDLVNELRFRCDNAKLVEK